jgi:hypothetical protein
METGIQRAGFGILTGADRAVDRTPPSAGSAPDARYQVGIDLGTTHCALAYVDGAGADARVRDFPIPQIVAPGETEVRPVLPSFGYEPAPGEFPSGSLVLPGGAPDAPLVGWFARQQGALAPGRLIASAKSWLCHPGVDRTAPLLPWHGAPDVPRLSPVEASARYLGHLRAAWDRAFPAHPLAAQDVAVTVPASFDEVARELTVKAAEKAGLKNITLIEEPQAVFYAWMASEGAGVLERMAPGQLTLVCDVGGGTTDLTLIEARATSDGRVRFHRVAVGEHLILGGDNMDLALAHWVEGRLPGGGKLEPRRWGLLVQACRHVKETLLAALAPERMSVSVAGGSRLVGGALQVELSREEVRSLVLDGFFPRVDRDARPSSVRSGFQEFGLPYAADAAITRHLAAFLADHRSGVGGGGDALGGRFPDQILFNGGVFESAILRERVVEQMEAWRRADADAASRTVTVLNNPRLDLAVARGAAHAMWLKRHGGVRIAAGLSRAYYIQVGRPGGGPPTTLCLAPAGLEEGHSVELAQRFVLRLRQPVAFSLFSSGTRLQDRAGDEVAADPTQLTPLPPISTVIRAGRSVEAGTAEVHLRAQLTEIGTLDVRCVEVGLPRSWRLEFDVRGNAGRGRRGDDSRSMSKTAAAADLVEDSVLSRIVDRIRRAFGSANGGEDPSALVRVLESEVGLERTAWPLPLLRGVWESLMDVDAGRGRTVAHETRWLNLLGFALRPGYGFTVDDWRVQQTWKLFQGGTAFPRNEQCRAEWCILWRRIAGGLPAGHQKIVLEPYTGVFRERGGRKLHWGVHELAEIWRLLGSLELLPVPVKMELGDFLVGRLERRLEPALVKAGGWALGRLGARVPVYGPLNTLVPAEGIEGWLDRILRLPGADPEMVFAVVQMVRPTGDRYRDLDEAVRATAVRWLEQHQAPPHLVVLARDGGMLEAAEETQVVGDALPPGLHLCGDEVG